MRGRESAAELAELVAWRDGGAIVDWVRLEQLMSTPLPVDYRQYVTTFPNGIFQSWLAVVTPFPGCVLEQFVAYLSREASGWSASYFDELPPSMFPEPGGLIPWGMIETDWLLCWETSGSNPDAWPCLLLEADGRSTHLFDGPMTEIIRQIIVGSPSLPELRFIADEQSPPEFVAFDHDIYPLVPWEDWPIGSDTSVVRRA